MSSGLRLPAVSGNFYASVVDGNAPYYTVNSAGVWSGATTNVDMTGLLFHDLGKVVYFHPVNSELGSPTAPPVDVRKVAVVDATGVVTGTTYYVPLGTRVRGTRAQQNAIPSCWIAQSAAAVTH